MDNRRAGGVRARRVIVVTLWVATMAAVSLAGPAGRWLRDDRPVGATEPAATEAPDTPPARDVTPTDMDMVLSLVLGVLAGAGLGWGASRLVARRTGGPQPSIAESAPNTVSDLSQDRSVDTSRSRVVEHLVEGLIASYDLATNDAQRARIRDALRRAEVIAIEPDALSPFDPVHHKALAVEPDSDPAKAGRIARVERPGWTRGDELLRAPEVTVYPRSDPPPG